jgi:hypothetical protein
LLVQFPDAANAEAVDGDALRDAASVLLLTGDDAVVRTHGRTARLDATMPWSVRTGERRVST